MVKTCASARSAYILYIDICITKFQQFKNIQCAIYSQKHFRSSLEQITQWCSAARARHLTRSRKSRCRAARGSGRTPRESVFSLQPSPLGKDRAQLSPRLNLCSQTAVSLLRRWFAPWIVTIQLYRGWKKIYKRVGKRRLYIWVQKVDLPKVGISFGVY